MNGPFIALPVAAFKDKRLDGNAQLVLSALHYHAGAKMTCYPGMARLAEETGLSKNTVLAKVALLKDCGYVAARRRGQGRTNTYELFEAPRAAAESADCASRSPNSGLLEVQKAGPKPDAGELDPVGPEPRPSPAPAPQIHTPRFQGVDIAGGGIPGGEGGREGRVGERDLPPARTPAFRGRRSRVDDRDDRDEIADSGLATGAGDAAG